MEIRELEPIPSQGTARRLRVTTTAGRATTVCVARYDRSSTFLRIALVDPSRPLQAWCNEHGVTEALSGGYFTQLSRQPLGDLHIDGNPLAFVPFREPWNRRRGAIHVDGAGIYIGALDELLTRSGPVQGDELQAGPLLVRGGRIVVDAIDPEGFSSTHNEFDSDITVGPLPRTAIGISADELFAVTVDGQSSDDAGLTLSELADCFVQLGATDALNLDGGSSSTLICDGKVRNRPRNERGIELPDGYPTTTAFTFRVG